MPPPETSTSFTERVRNSFPETLTLLYFAFLILLMTHHEMWRDELQAWDIARNSPNLTQLFRNLSYEGNPGLWHLLLFPLTRITRDPWLMQFFHATIASSTILIVAKFSPFTKLQKILFATGYFMIFEYAVISRNYALGVFFFFLTIILYGQKEKNTLKTALTTVALSLTSVYGAILSVTFLALFSFDTLNGVRRRREVPKPRELLPHLIIFCGILISLLLSLPPADHAFATTTRTGFDLLEQRRAVTKIWQTYVPIPEDRTLFWNSNLIYERERQYDLSLILVAITLSAIANSPQALVVYFTGTLSLLLFSYLKYPGELRHNGHLFLIFTASIWLAERSKKSQSLPSSQRIIRSGFFTIILILQTYAAFIATKNDWTFPFSPTKELALYLEENFPKEVIIIGDRDSHTSGVAFHLDRKIYYPQTGREESYIVWNKARRSAPQGEKATLSLAKKLYHPPTPLLLVLSYPLTSTGDAKLLYQTGETAINKRPLYLYLYEPK